MQKNVGMPGAGTLAVALVEDDLSFRGLVRAAIATAADLRLEAEAGDLRGGLALLAGPAADVLIVDLGLSLIHI